VEGDARVARETADHLGMFVSGIVVEDDVDGLLGTVFSMALRKRMNS
jgi:hypothetical protein